MPSRHSHFLMHYCLDPSRCKQLPAGYQKAREKPAAQQSRYESRVTQKCHISQESQGKKQNHETQKRLKVAKNGPACIYFTATTCVYFAATIPFMVCPYSSKRKKKKNKYQGASPLCTRKEENRESKKKCKIDPRACPQYSSKKCFRIVAQAAD